MPSSAVLLKKMSKKKKAKRWDPDIEVEVVNISTKKQIFIKLSDEKVFFDEKTDTYQVIPHHSSNYMQYVDEKET